MPIGPVRRALVSVSVIAFTALASACSSGTLSDPGDAKLISNPEAKASGPSGLEQRVAMKIDPAPPGSPYTALLTATSTIVNTGSAPVRLTSRMCFFQESDVETTARLDRYEPLISCGAVSMEGDLAPGQSTPPMEVQFGVRSGAGTYTLKLRHALAPEFRAEASFKIP